MRLCEFLEDENIALEQIKTNCSEAISALKTGVKIFRGIPSYDEYILIDPKLKMRKSTTGLEYYNILMSNLPNWRKFPRRDRSLICSTSESTADLFARISNKGTTYLVLPFNGAKFGVCPSDDIFGSKLNIKNGMGFDSINLFYSKARISDYSFKDLLITGFKNKNSLSSRFLDDYDMPLRQEFEKVKTLREFLALLQKLYDPVKCGFKLLPIEKLNLISREVWTDSKAYLVRVGSDIARRLENEN